MVPSISSRSMSSCQLVKYPSQHDCLTYQLVNYFGQLHHLVYQPIDHSVNFSISWPIEWLSLEDP